MSISVIPYLNFNGECEEAVRLYTEALGGEIYYLSRWSELNTKDPDRFGKVMHVEFRAGDTHMSAGDSFDRKEPSANIKLMVHMDDPQKASATCELLSRGGSLISPLAPHPAPDDGGMGALVEDRFGYCWIITCPNPDKR
ncbi:MAG: VOC family protein [Oscillospiraceae bacterium]|nr:VOC family protein [Oscillospiraceae bacterium]